MQGVAIRRTQSASLVAVRQCRSPQRVGWVAHEERLDCGEHIYDEGVYLTLCSWRLETSQLKTNFTFSMTLKHLLNRHRLFIKSMLIVITLLIISKMDSFAQRQRNYIYVLDCTSSMKRKSIKIKKTSLACTLSFAENIESPEDIHFMIVSTIQRGKHLSKQFDC